MGEKYERVGSDPTSIPDQRISNAIKLVHAEVTELKERVEEVAKALVFLQERVETLEVRDIGYADTDGELEK